MAQHRMYLFMPSCLPSCLSRLVAHELGCYSMMESQTPLPCPSSFCTSLLSLCPVFCLLSQLRQGQTGTRVMMKQPRLLGASVPALQSVTNTYQYLPKPAVAVTAAAAQARSRLSLPDHPGYFLLHPIRASARPLSGLAATVYTERRDCSSEEQLRANVYGQDSKLH